MNTMKPSSEGASRRRWQRIIGFAVGIYLIIVIGIVAYAFVQIDASLPAASIGTDGSHGTFSSSETIYIYRGTTLLGSNPYRTVDAHTGTIAHVHLPKGTYSYFLGSQIGTPSTSCTMGYGMITVTSSDTNVMWYPPFCH